MSSADRKRFVFVFLGLFVLCFVLFQFGNSNVGLTDPDDVFYADTAKEMLSHHSWLVPIMFGQPQFEKPPLYYWLLMLSFQLFGVTAFAARVVGEVVGFAGVIGTFLFVRKFIGEREGLLSAIILATSIWWIGLSRVVLTDLLFSVLIMFALYSFLAWHKDRRSVWLSAFGVCTALATLAKSPLGLFLPILVIVVFLLIQKEYGSIKDFLLSHWWILYVVIAAPWYVYVTVLFRYQFVWEFFIHDHWHRLLMAEHPEFNKWYFYFAAVGFGFIPWTPYILFLKGSLKSARPYGLFLVIWIVVMGLFFGFAQSKLTTYISPIYPAMAILVALGITEVKPTRGLKIITGGLLIVLAAGLGAGATVVASKYPELASPALVTFGALAVVLLISGVLMLAGRVVYSVMASAGGVVLFALLAATIVFGRLEQGLTQSNLIPLMSRYDYAGKPLLCSKLFVRGAFFYTGNPVVVMADNQQPFWSNHPVPIISSDTAISDFVQSRDTLVGVLSGGDLARLTRLCPSTARIDTVMSDMGKTIVVCYLHPQVSTAEQAISEK